jgi:uncharacterized membrane protein
LTRASREASPPAGAHPAADNVRAVSQVEQEELRGRSSIEWIADAIARAAASTASLVVHALFFGGWLLVNTRQLPGLAAFDPFPFGLLTTIVSLEAIFLSLFILVSQNRMSRQAERREHLDLQINLLAEQESTATLKLLRRLCEHQGVDLKSFDAETRDLEKKTSVQELIDEIDHRLPAASSPTSSS